MLAIGFLEEIILFELMIYKSTAEINLENLFKDSEGNKPVGFYIELIHAGFRSLYLTGVYLSIENSYIICNLPENKKVLNTAEIVNILHNFNTGKSIHFIKETNLKIIYDTINIIPVYKNTDNKKDLTTVTNSIFN